MFVGAHFLHLSIMPTVAMMTAPCQIRSRQWPGLPPRQDPFFKPVVGTGSGLGCAQCFAILVGAAIPRFTISAVTLFWPGRSGVNPKQAVAAVGA
jgi:hypothetical protein